MSAAHRNAQGDQGVSRRSGGQGRDFRARARRDPCAARRERRRQVDADQDHGRASTEPTAARCCSTASPSAFTDAGRGARARHRHGVPGDQPGAVDDGRPEPLSRRREVLQPPARHLHRRAAVPAVAEFPGRSDGDRRHLGAAKKQMVEIARAVQPKRPGHHLRRADRVADARGEASFLRSDRAAEGARRVDHLHLACAGGGAADRRPHHHAARRRACRHRRHRELRPRQDHPRHGRPHACPTSSTASGRGSDPARRREGAERPEPVDGQRRAQQLLLGLSPARSPACSG